MPDDAGEKTEAPTPRKLQEARSKGNVAKSNDLNAALGLLGGLFCLSWFGTRILAAWLEFLRESLSTGDPSSFASIDIVEVVESVGTTIFVAVGPILAGLVVVAFLSNVLQVGLLLTGKPLMPTLNKLNPINGVKRLFSTKTLVQFAMNMVKLTVVSFVAYHAIHDRIGDILMAMEMTGWRQIGLMGTLIYEIGLQLAMTLLVIALLDFGWQKYKHQRDLRMSKFEVKEELRRMEGDPIMKQRRRRAQFAAAIQRIRGAVPTADVVVTNPTELAIAIKYDAEQMAAPRVVAKGQGLLAAKIREIAMAHGVPIVQRKALAQTLYKMVDVGHEIPERFYKAIAEILAYVYELSGRSSQRPVAPAA